MNYKELNEMLENIKNPIIGKALLTTYHKLNLGCYKKVLCSISGGSDSDIMLDIVYKCDTNKIVDYVYFNTGLEYGATKDHVRFLEDKYNINIEILRPKKPIPIVIKEYGEPFLSKQVSEFIQRLQSHNFKWEDKPYEELIKEYPNCKSALKWWCNENGDGSKFGINRNKWLKEFMVANPPTFKITNKCCKYAKKDLAHNKLKEGYDLNLVGVRKAEGGVRSAAYKSCFDNNGDTYDNFRPIFWFKDEDKEEYRKLFNVSNSKCYGIYGLKRTGCAGCPYGRDCKEELEIINKYESKLYKAVSNLFTNSYEYTKAYEEFKNIMKNK